MAARTRSAIKTLVESHTGRTKATLENSLCNTALQVALMEHHFKDAQSVPSDFTITEDATSVDISSITDLFNIVTARIVEASGSRNNILKFKTRGWWDSHVVNPEDNQKGWPEYGMRVGSTIVLDRPAKSGIELRLRVTTKQSFTDDTTVCPIALLDVFVEYYVTAQVFLDLENDNAYKRWMTNACGVQYLLNGKIGGALATAIKADGIGDSALEIQSEPAETLDPGSQAMSVRNMITGHDDYGNTRTWR